MSISKLFIVDRSSGTAPVAFGKAELTGVLEKAGVSTVTAGCWPDEIGEDLWIVAGESTGRLVSKLLCENGVTPAAKQEGVIFQWCETGGGRVLVVSGTDERGMMYALLELADRVRCRGAQALLSVENLEEYPDNQVRGVDRFLMSSRDDGWFYSEEFWSYLVERLAKTRFNRLTLITGFDTAYMTPPYPFFVDVPGFEDIHVKGMADEVRSKNLNILRRVSEICASRGVDFFFGTWQQMPWTKNQEFMIENIPADDLSFTKYCAEGMRLLLLACPGINGVQLRVNLEAGVRAKQDGASEDKAYTHVDFWSQVVDAIASIGRPIKLDIRAKGLSDKLLKHARNTGLDISVPTKYWCEHAALPYHIPQMRSEELARPNDTNFSRRYSYDDLLKKPHWYDMIYRLWNYGSINLFLWSDPDYCRRFAKSCSLGGGTGFEINTPLSLKGGHHFIPGDNWPIHINSEIIDYTWEDERYWAYYLAFGRFGYRVDTDVEVWQREFDSRFGNISGAVGAAYRLASRVMPLITTVHFPVHPSLHNWPELYSGAALFSENNYDPFFEDLDYSTSLPSDEALFYSIAQYTDDLLEGKLQGKYTPLQARDWLKNLADGIRAALGEMGESFDTPELKAIRVDFSMIADIAEFHAWKIKSAFHLSLFRKTGNGAELVPCYEAICTARDIWKDLSKLGNDYYNHNLEFNAGTGTKRNGNWENRLHHDILPDIARIEKLMEENGVHAGGSGCAEYRSMLVSDGFADLSFSSDVPARCEAGRDLVLHLKTGSLNESAVGEIRLHYRHTNLREGLFRSVSVTKTAEGYTAVIPADYIVPEWDLLLYFSCISSAGNVLIYPGVYSTQSDSPYFVVEVDQSAR